VVVLYKSPLVNRVRSNQEGKAALCSLIFPGIEAMKKADASLRGGDKCTVFTGGPRFGQKQGKAQGRGD
jgi:hypothetical protein